MLTINNSPKVLIIYVDGDPHKAYMPLLGGHHRNREKFQTHTRHSVTLNDKMAIYVAFL
jgi:hypothetical protein